MKTGFLIFIIILFTINSMVFANKVSNNDQEKATFAGGCFWCMEPPFEKLEGVKEVISGYTGGSKENPTYKEVSSGKTGHMEAVQIIYQPSKINYSKLLDTFWRNIDPTDSGGQFVDRGTQYRTAIFYHNQEQKNIAEESRKKLEQSGKFEKPVVTEIIKFKAFYEAESYHQDFYKTNPGNYKLYKHNSGREQYLKKKWDDKMENNSSANKYENFRKPPDEELKKMLTPLQYKVTQQNGTEPPFKNKYWDNQKEGIYVDIVSGEHLFSSLEKFKSGTGWPSFTKPLDPENISERKDRSFFTVRTEVRSKHADSHLGHVFKDGPPPTGLRYCINSAALRFIPKEDLEEEGYGKYKSLFDTE